MWGVCLCVCMHTHTHSCCENLFNIHKYIYMCIIHTHKTVTSHHTSRSHIHTHIHTHTSKHTHTRIRTRTPYTHIRYKLFSSTNIMEGINGASDVFASCDTEWCVFVCVCVCVFESVFFVSVTTTHNPKHKTRKNTHHTTHNIQHTQRPRPSNFSPLLETRNAPLRQFNERL